MKPIVACGAQDGEKLFEGSYVESPVFLLYRLNPGGHDFLERVENIALDEEAESTEDTVRAKSVGSLLKAKSVNVLLARRMGPNIREASRSFVPVISGESAVDKAVELVLDNLHLVEREWRKGEKREHLVFGDR